MISGLILAGGRGARLGQEKAVAPLAGRALLQWVASALSPLIDELVVVVAPGKGPESYRTLLGPAAKIVTDRVGGRGPMEGLVVGLGAVEGDFVCLAPCDTPFLNPDVYRALKAASKGREGAVVHTEALQALIGFFRTDPLRRAVEEAMTGPEPSPRGALESLDLARLSLESFPGVGRDFIFLNVNTRDDLEEAERIVLTRGLTGPSQGAYGEHPSRTS